MSKIQYLHGINNIELKNLNSWIKDYILEHQKNLIENEVILANYDSHNKSYKIVLAEEQIKNDKCYFIALYINKKCMLKNFIAEENNFSYFKDSFIKQLLILKKMVKGEDILALKAQKINLETNTKGDIINDSIGFTNENKANIKRYKLCTNCIHIDIGTNKKPPLRCKKRNCKLADKTEGTWCKFYEESNNHI